VKNSQLVSFFRLENRRLLVYLTELWGVLRVLYERESAGVWAIL
jgi:hypothetical protein